MNYDSSYLVEPHTLESVYGGDVRVLLFVSKTYVPPLRGSEWGIRTHRNLTMEYTTEVVIV